MCHMIAFEFKCIGGNTLLFMHRLRHIYISKIPYQVKTCSKSAEKQCWDVWIKLFGHLFFWLSKGFCPLYSPHLFSVLQIKRSIKQSFIHLQQNHVRLWCQSLTNYHHLHQNICYLIEILLLILASSAIVEQGLLSSVWNSTAHDKLDQTVLNALLYTDKKLERKVRNVFSLLSELSQMWSKLWWIPTSIFQTNYL